MHTKAEIIAHLSETAQMVKADLAAMTPEQFEHSIPPEWSASGYLKHLLLSVKPLVKGLKVPRLVLAGMFGKAKRESMSYAQLVETYQQRLNEGVRAEDFSDVIPQTFRIPAEATDEKAYLCGLWDKANADLIEALDTWNEQQLDQHVLPHPAIGPITVREMLFFTAYHNRLHGQDIQRVSG
jgi:hypothetical protein